MAGSLGSTLMQERALVGEELETRSWDSQDVFSSNSIKYIDFQQETAEIKVKPYICNENK